MFLHITDQSSTALHLLLYVHQRFTIFWFILEILLFIFKYYHVPYPSNAFGIELAMIFMLCSNEFVRQFFAIKGNLTLKVNHLIISIVWGVFCIIGFVFFLVWQSYIQRAEILLSAIGLALIVLEMILSLITIIRNSRIVPGITREQQRLRIQQAQTRFQLSAAKIND